MNKFNSQDRKSLFVWLTQLGVALLYLLFGVIIHQNFTVHSIVSVIWPGSGLALAALLIGGKRYIWGIFLGSLTLNLISNNSLWAICGITLANVLEALVAVWLLTRNAHPTKSLRTLADYLKLILLGGAFAGTVGAVIGSLSILLAGYINLADLAMNIFHWWMGDALGVLLVTPFALAWHQEWRKKIAIRKTLETLLLVCVTLFVGQIVFFDWLHKYLSDTPKGYLLFLCISWVAIRTDTRSTTLVLLLVAVQALTGAYHGMGIFAHDIAQASLQSYWAYMLTLSIVGMAVTTNVNEIKNAFDALHESERRYYLLFNTNPMPMWVFEEGNLKFLMVNDRAIEHYGYTREEFRRMTLRDICPVEDNPELDQVIASTATGKVSGEWRHKKKDGTIIYVEINTEPIKYGNTHARLVHVQDITERKLIDAERNRLLKIIEEATDYIGMSDLQGHLQFHNIAATRMLGLPDDVDLSVMKIKDMHPEWAAKLVLEEGVPTVLREGFWRHETALLHRDGHEIPVSQILLLHRDASGKPEFLSTIMRDITERRQNEEKLRESEASLRAILDNVPYLIWLKDTDGRFIAVNESFFNATGRASMDEVIGKTDFDLWPKELAEKYRANDEDVISSRKHTITEEMSLDKGELKWVETFKAPVLDKDGNILGTTGFARDTTEHKRSQDIVRHMAHFDMLTDLPNRALLSDRLQQALFIAKRDKKHLALMFIDLDKFKPINDEFGHHLGDLLLKEAANRMQDCVRESDTVARMGGDEFVVLLPVIEAEQDAILVAEKIRHTLNRPFVLEGQSLNISSSAGIAVYPEHGIDEMQLVNNADIAMYHAKENGRNNVMLYRTDMLDDNW